MKNLTIVLLCVIMQAGLVNAQNTNDIGRIVLHTVVIDKDNKLPTESKTLLETKLSQIATNYGLGGSSINPRFVIAAKVDITTKDAVAGPPQMIALNAEITFFIGDAVNNELFASTNVSLKGVGTNETKALIDVIKNINTKSKALDQLVDNGKNKIVNYYNQQCDFIIAKSKTIADKQDFDQAIYELMQVPAVCKECYMKCMNAVKPIWENKINRECTLKLNEAKNKWNANPNRKGADEVAITLASIEPAAECYKEALNLTNDINQKIEADEKRAWEFKLKKYADGVKLEQQKIESAKATALAYIQNQPKTIIYNKIFW